MAEGYLYSTATYNELLFPYNAPAHIKEDDYRFASELSAQRTALKWRMVASFVLAAISMYVLSQNSYTVFGISFDSSQPLKVLFNIFRFMWLPLGCYICIGVDKLFKIDDDQMGVDKVLRIHEEEEYEENIRQLREKEERDLAAIRRKHAQENKA